jgi:hypothetical protein
MQCHENNKKLSISTPSYVNLPDIMNHNELISYNLYNSTAINKHTNIIPQYK